MNLRYAFTTLFSTFNPNAYKELVSRKLGLAFSYFFFALTLSVIAMLILFIPFTLSFAQTLPKTFANVQVFTITTNVSMNDSITLFKSPEVIVDLNKTQPGQESVLITKQYLFYKPFLLFGEKNISLQEFSDLKKHETKAVTLMVSIFIFLIPAIVVFVFLFFTIKNLLLALIVSFFAYIIYKLAHYDISFVSLFKAALYASTFLVIGEIILLFFYPQFLISTIVFVFIFILASWGMATKHFAIKQKKKPEPEEE
jgi:hypothetical protein